MKDFNSSVKNARSTSACPGRHRENVYYARSYAKFMTAQILYMSQSLFFYFTSPSFSYKEQLDACASKQNCLFAVSVHSGASVQGPERSGGFITEAIRIRSLIKIGAFAPDIMFVFFAIHSVIREFYNFCHILTIQRIGCDANA